MQWEFTDSSGEAAVIGVVLELTVIRINLVWLGIQMLTHEPLAGMYVTWTHEPLAGMYMYMDYYKHKYFALITERTQNPITTKFLCTGVLVSSVILQGKEQGEAEERT